MVSKLFIIFLILIVGYKCNTNDYYDTKLHQNYLKDLVKPLNCLKKEHFPGKIGHLNVTAKNYDEFQNENITLLVISMNNCKSCCYLEQILEDLMSFSKLKKYWHVDNPLIIGRLDFAKETWITEQYRVERLPLIILKYQQESYVYDSYLEVARIIRWIHGIILSKVHEFNTLEQLEAFIFRNPKDLMGDKIISTHIVGIFYDVEETEQDQKEFRRAFEKMKGNRETYFSMLTNKEEIKNKAKRKYGDSWFIDYSLSTVVIIKGNATYKVDLSTLAEDQHKRSLSYVLEEKGSPLFPELNFQKYNQYDKGRLPTILALLNSCTDPEQFKKLILMYENIAQKYVGVVNFAWVDPIFTPMKRILLGFTPFGKYPLMAVQKITDNVKIAYPEHWVVNNETIIEFTEDLLNLTTFDMQLKYNLTFQKLQKPDIYDIFEHTIEGDSKLIENTFKEQKLALVFVFNSKLKEKLNKEYAVHFNHAARRFKELNIKPEVMFISLDMIFEELNPRLMAATDNFPAVLFIPKNVLNEKNSPESQTKGIRVYEGEINSLGFMKFVQENEKKIKLPELAHVPEQYVATYIKKQMEGKLKDDDYFYMKKELQAQLYLVG